MATVTARRPRTTEEWARIDARLDALMAELDRDDAIGRRLAEAWLAGRTYEEEAEPSCMEVRCDGWSAFIEGDCIATWQPGPRRLYNPDVALVSDRRLRTGGFEIRARCGFTHVLEERTVPVVRVVPPYPCPYDLAQAPRRRLGSVAGGRAHARDSIPRAGHRRFGLGVDPRR
jgi:hypothetical protein